MKEAKMAVKNESQQQQHGRLTMHATCFRGVGGFSDGGGSLWSRPKATTIAGVWIARSVCSLPGTIPRVPPVQRGVAACAPHAANMSNRKDLRKAKSASRGFIIPTKNQNKKHASLWLFFFINTRSVHSSVKLPACTKSSTDCHSHSQSAIQPSVELVSLNPLRSLTARPTHSGLQRN